MGNNVPKEGYFHDRVRCIKCQKVLPPCHSFNNICKVTIHGRYVHQFNGGEYYRPVGYNESYECNYCFHKPIRDRERMQEEERKRKEQERREEEERKRQEEREERLTQRLLESQLRAKEQHEAQLQKEISEEHESKQNIVRAHLDEFENDFEDVEREELLQVLSLKCGFKVSDLSLPELTAEQLGKILSALDKLLFDEWIGALPSLGTLQRAQVYITELCALSVEMSEGVSLQSICYQVQSLVESISQSASDVSESFMLTQALYLTLMHFFNDRGGSDTDGVMIAKKWADIELSSEELFATEFLSVLTTSLQSAVSRTSVYILKMETQCLELLLTRLNDNETHSESTEMIMKLVQMSQWTPTEALTLLKALTQKCEKDDSITRILVLVQVYDISPDWKDESGRSLIQALDSIDAEKVPQDFQMMLRKKDESGLTEALAELQISQGLDDSVINMIKSITTGVLKYSENPPKSAAPSRDTLKCGAFNTEDLQNCLSQLCRAVFDTKGWWPTVRHMLQWCGLVLREKTGVPQLVGVVEELCAIALFSATQVCLGNKVNIVLGSEYQSKEQTEDWSDFYRSLGISLNTRTGDTNSSFDEVYKADIVHLTLDVFVSDYFQHGVKVTETGVPHPARGFIIEEQSLSTSHNLELSSLKSNESLMFSVAVLQNLMNKTQYQDMETKQSLIKALFQVLHNLNQVTNTDKKMATTLKKITGKGLPAHEDFILTFLENFLAVVSSEPKAQKLIESPAYKWCVEILFTCVAEFKDSTEETKEIFQMVANLKARTLWSPEGMLNLLGALTDHHHDQGCISMMKILHLMATYQVSSKWTDEKNLTVLELLKSFATKDLIKHLEKSFESDDSKDVETLFDEIRQMKDNDEETLKKAYDIVTYVNKLITNNEMEKHKDLPRAKSLSHSKNTEDLQEVLAVLCNAVHLQIAGGKWFPRISQMISWCLLALSDSGKLLEMGTGEGKSCVIAMFAALRVFRGEKVDVVSSSSVLCERDAAECSDFFKYLGITVDVNTNKTEDDARKSCYQKDVIYGTIETFAADHLRQIFEMKDVRPDRSYQCIIIDEVDSLLLDQGVQLTYLSSPMVSMQHLNTILAMIWGHVCQYGFLSTGQKSFVQAPPASFYTAIFDSINTEDTEIDDPMDILQIAEESNTVPQGFTEEIYKTDKKEVKQKLKTVSQDAVVDFFEELESYVPYGFTVYTLNEKGLLCLRKLSPYNRHSVPELTFLVLEDGMCCALYDSEEILINPIAELISDKIQYTPCTTNKDKVSIPGFLKSLIDKKVSVWVRNAFLGKQLREGRDYVVENNNICPVDFRSTGIIELNKKWGDGLQQFVELKHQLKLSTISTVTNYISNIAFFQQYQGKIYGTTGTLGSKKDMQFLMDLYPSLSACRMPTFNRKKLFEVKGIVTKSSEEWKSEIKKVVMAQISPNSFRDGRAALVICETINRAKEIHDELKGVIPGEIILYCRSDNNSLSKIEKKLLPGDVIVATNLAGRGTNIKVSKEVNKNGGLFVILSFLSENTRVERQAFGRTARKGKPGSAQIITATEHMQQDFSEVTSPELAKSTRDRLAAEIINVMMGDVAEMNLREDLFSEYCKTLRDIYKSTDGDERRAVVAIMNEFWGIWLQNKSEEIDKLQRDELQQSLKADLKMARSQTQSQTSPCSSIYHYINFGNNAMSEKKWDLAAKLLEKAMKQDESWASIAFYSHAFCTIKQQKENYLSNAREDLRKAQENLRYLNEDALTCLQFVKMASAQSTKDQETSLENQLTTRCSMLSYFDKNISEAIQKLDEIKEKKRDALAKKSPVFSLVSKANEELQAEAYNLYNQGLKYVFAVEEKPRFCWEGLLVFFLGILQIIGGALLAVFTCGALAQVGMGLITEGISDCITGIEAMITGKFSWTSWAIDKAISIGLSLIGFGVGKLVAKGFKAAKTLFKAIGKHMKKIPKLFSKQIKHSFSTAVKSNLKNSIKQTAKTLLEQTITLGLGKAEEKLMEEILRMIKSEVKKGILNDVKSHIDKEPLVSLIDSIILLQTEDTEQLSYMLKHQYKKNDLLNIFKQLSKTAAQPFYDDLTWQNKLNSSIISVMNTAKSGAKGKLLIVLTAIQATHYAVIAAEAIASVVTLSERFFSQLQNELKTYKKGEEKVKKTELSSSDLELLKAFKTDLADTISSVIADAMVEVFHKKFSGHVISQVQNKVNMSVMKHVKGHFKSEKPDEQLKTGQNNKHITSVAVNLSSKVSGERGKLSRLHAQKIKNPKTVGTMLDVRVLSEATGTRIVILTEGTKGRFTTMQAVNPSTKPASQTVTLIYRPKSAKYTGGHYDVRIKDKIVSLDSDGGLFHAVARGMKPQASTNEIALEAGNLRTLEADVLNRQPAQWESFMKRNEWKDDIRGGNWYMSDFPTQRIIIKESRARLKKNEYTVKVNKEWQSPAKSNPGLGKVVNSDKQPPTGSVLHAMSLNQSSKLAKAMLEVGTRSSVLMTKAQGRELPAIHVPKEKQWEYTSTKSRAFRELLSTTISQDNVVGTFKLTVFGAMVSCQLDIGTKNKTKSKSRLVIFEESFQKHSENMVKTWSEALHQKGLVTNDQLATITAWIKEKGYKNPSDPLKKEVSKLIQ
ncbi:uncharacterized protein ACNS7B_019401 [Menidia menidia]